MKHRQYKFKINIVKHLHKIGLDGLEVPDVANLQAFNGLAYRFKQTATSKPLYFENHIHLLNKWLVSV